MAENAGIRLLVIDHLTVKIANKKDPSAAKVLLNDIDASVTGGSLFAILGGSGSGKTTLLNVIADRYDKRNTQLVGSVRHCGYHSDTVGYVSQEDSLLPFLTVTETVLFTSMLKISSNDCRLDLKLSGAERYRRLVDGIVTELGLSDCANTKIGLAGDGMLACKGISGGQKRRLSVALQMVADPDLLCADEPSSGLDAFTARTVIESLKSLTKGKRHTTVVCSIHQPRADIFQLFDVTLLLSKGGNPIYCGATAGMISYFEHVDFKCPIDSNPADFFVDISSLDSQSEMEMQSARRVQELVRLYRDRATNAPVVEANHNVDHATVLATRSYAVPWTVQCYLLTWRFILNSYRSRSNVLGGFVQAMAISLVTMGLFWQLSEDALDDIEARNGLLYLVSSLEYYILMIILIERYCTELKVFDREYQDHLYSPASYFVSHLASNLPVLVIQPVIFAIPIYYGTNLREGGTYILVFVLVNILLSLCVNGLAWISVSLHRDFAVASLVGNMQYTFITLTSGFLVNLHEMPPYVVWVKNISYLSYTYRILMSNEFHDRTFPGCTSTNPAACSQYDGNSILDSQDVGINDYHALDTWGAIVIIGTIYYVSSVVNLYVFKFSASGSVDDAGEESLESVHLIFGEANTYETTINSVDEAEKEIYSAGVVVDISISNVYVQTNFSVPVVVSTVTNEIVSSHSNKKQILQSVKATIEPSRLTVLLGPSGCGKTTLLNLIAGRIPQNCLYSDEINMKRSTAYSGSGTIQFNKQTRSSNTIRQICSYVQQFDFHLPSLTVFETLLFHASFKLHSTASLEVKKRRVMGIVAALGLLSCVHTRVGGEGIKGLSGGEKRRLTVGVQLLANPSVCLLDEPTTGLDAHTARHVMQTLKSLSLKGKTVVVSIHQPRYDIFQLADDVILLSHGGGQVWAGPRCQLLDHLAAIGHPCPPLMNPADFLLDITSVDYRSPDMVLESISRLKVLVSKYSEKLLTPTVAVDQNGFQDCETIDSHAIYLDFLEKPLIFSLSILLNRSILNLSRQPMLCSARLSQGIFFALILCAFYAPVGDNQNAIQNIIGNLYELTALCFIGMLSCIAQFPMERNVFFREYADGTYSALSFYLAYFVIAIPFVFICALLVAVLMTHGIGLLPTAEGFVLFSGMLFVMLFFGECIGVMFCSAFLHIGFSVNIMSMCISIFNMMVGFVAPDMPAFFVYAGNFSPVKWAAIVLANAVLDGQQFSCSSEEQTADGSCPLSTGEDVLELYSMEYGSGKYSDQRFYILMTVLLTVVYFVLTFVVIRLKVLYLSH